MDDNTQKGESKDISDSGKREDPKLLEVLELLGAREKKSRRRDFVRIKFSDIGKILELLRSLDKTGSGIVQMRINHYLGTVTSASLGFLVEESFRSPEASVRVIGNQKLHSSLVFQKDNEFLQRIRKTDEPLEVPDFYLDPNLRENINDILKYSYDTNFKNCYIFPIFHPYLSEKLFYYGLINLNLDLKPISHYHGLVGECFRYTNATVLHALRCEEEKHYHEKYKDILKLNSQSLKFEDNFPQLIVALREQACLILGASKCSVYFVEGKELVSYISECGQGYECSTDEMKRIRIPIGEGIVGTVAQTGEVYICDDPQTDELCREGCLRELTRYSSNVLAFPLLVYRSVFGVAEVHNKRQSLTFCSGDGEFAKVLGQLFGVQLHLCLAKKKLWDFINRRAILDGLFLADTRTSYSGEAQDVLDCSKPHDYPDFDTFSFIPANVKYEDVLCLILETFEREELLKRHFIERADFVRFLIRIRNRHRSLPLHNWQHAFSVFHFLRVISYSEQFMQYERVTHLELLGMYLSGLCHGMECRGMTTVYQPTAGTTLASLYSSPGSLLQVYALSQIIRIMSSNENNIIESMDLEMYRNFVKTMDQMLSFMDLAHHVTHREEICEAIPKFDLNNYEHKKMTISLLLTCASLSDYIKPYGYCNNFSDVSLDEFFQTDLSQCEGVIDLTGFKEDTDLKKVDLQLHFAKTICEEAFRMLKEIFPRSADCYAAVLENIELFKTKRDEVIAKQQEF